MIKSVTIKNFKSIKEQTYEFTNFDLLVGRNNCGKSTVLQALAIWQYAVEEFRRRHRSTGESGIQVVLPNFTVLPVPELDLLWTEMRGKKGNNYVLIEIVLRWNGSETAANEFGVEIRWQTPQSAYIIPQGGWGKFKELDGRGVLPTIVYVPPFSGLEPSEELRDDSIVRKQVGKAQPGSVLRNLLFRVIDRTPFINPGPLTVNEKPVDSTEWQEIAKIIDDLFGVRLNPPRYEKGIDTQITCTYSQKDKEYDIIAGGSGFHQVLTLLAFIYGYRGLNVILFDEPDAHLHTNLQRATLEYFKKMAHDKNIQFITATHAEEFVRGVAPERVVAVMSSRPHRIETTAGVVTALREVGNIEIARTTESPFILYVEGESDERIIQAWAAVLGRHEILGRFYIKTMSGGDKRNMQNYANRHFEGLKTINDAVKRVILFDYDDADSYHPEPNNPVLFEWRRRNIENYLLVDTAWFRAVGSERTQTNIFTKQAMEIITQFFEKENMTLPKNASWKTVDASIYKVVDGKKLLFEDENSLFQMIKKADLGSFNRETIAQNMKQDEIHTDVILFFDKLESVVNS
jgi:energy-coupling factor transporter ATP-binding protein EcfA2